MNKSSKITLDSMGQDKIDDIASAYKDVFSGHPWHEDLVCSNVLQGKCSTQYTPKDCNMDDGSNDCREAYGSRKSSDGKQEIFLLPEGGLENCVGCGEPLKTISFYPEFRNHYEIVGEALDKQGFSGLLARDDSGKLIGFSWGYIAPYKKTISVNFPRVNPLLAEQGISPDSSFYAAETGVVGEYQGQGVGSVISGARLLKAFREVKPKFLITRTLNPAVHSIFTKIFSGVEARTLFKDPEASGTWFAWDFDDFNPETVKSSIRGKLANPEII